MQSSVLPVGKLPPELLAEILSSAPVDDKDIVVGPGIGFDCAVVACGEHYLVLKSDPITFVSEDLGWYLVQVNVNDLATTGARPRWLMVTLLLPENLTDERFVRTVNHQIHEACRQVGISVVGGHTEVTHGLTRPLAVGTLVGDVSPEALITPAGMQSGDLLVLTKGIPIEATAILAKEFAPALSSLLPAEALRRAADFLLDPGISVLRDAQTAVAAGRVTAMHDPTEGGLLAALWELAEASGKSLVVDLSAVPVPKLAQKICDFFDINPLAAIASGALLMAVNHEDVDGVIRALDEEQIDAAVIGDVQEGPVAVWQLDGERRELLPRPSRDAISVLFEQVSE